MTRTDVHRPSAINTADYSFVAFECIRVDGLEACQIQLDNRARIRSHMERTGGSYSTHAHGGNCMVCGNANAIYTALFHHEPSNTYVRMGSECTEKVDMQLDRVAFHKFKDGIYQWREAQAGKRKAEAALAERGLSGAWAIFTATATVGEPFEERTTRDIVGKFCRYGSISEKQFAFLGRLLRQIDERSQTQERRSAEQAAATPIPDAMLQGRVVIRGEVVSFKTVDSPFGRSRKMLIKHQDGWKVWGTAPSSLVAEKGDTVAFVASIERSREDVKFGFFSRPSLINQGAERPSNF
jgi:hypothetical protein